MSLKQVIISLQLFIMHSASNAVNDRFRFNATTKAWHNELFQQFFGGIMYSTAKPSRVYSCASDGQKCCYCDDQCVIRKDCCFDKQFLKETLPPKHYIQYLISSSKKYSNIECSPIINMKLKNHRIQKIHMVKVCPKKFQYEEYCASDIYYDPANILPVIDKNGIVYANQKCAKCNDVIEYKPLLIEITECITGKFIKSLRKGRTELNIEKLNSCKITLQNKEIKICSNQRNYPIKRSIKCSALEFQLCKIYMGLSYDDFGNLWKNPLCVKCLVTKSKHHVGNCVSELQSPQLTNQTKKAVLKIDSVTDATLTIPRKNYKDYVSICKQRYIFDVRYGKCVQFSCNKNQIRKDADCIDLEMNGLLPVYNCLKKTTISVIIEFKNAHFTMNCFMKFLKYDPVFYHLEDNNKSYTVKDLTKKNVFIEQLRISKSINSGRTLLFFPFPFKEFLSYVLSINTICHFKVYITSIKNLNVTKLYGFDLNRIFLHNKLCAKYRQFKFTQVSNCKAVLPKNDQQVIETIYWIEKIGSVYQSYASQCLKFHLNQESCNLKREELKSFIRYTNQTIYINQTNNYYDPWNYLPMGNSIAVCNNKVNTNSPYKYSWQEDLISEKRIICVILCVLSVICLFVAIFMLSFIKESLLIKILITICISMIIYFSIYIITLFGNFSKDVNEILCMFLHWSALSKHLWVLILASHVYITRKNKTTEQRCSFSNYVVIILITVLCIITVCIIVNRKLYWFLTYEFKDDFFIGNLIGQLSTFFIPAVLLFILNITILLTLIDKKKNHSKDNEHSNMIVNDISYEPFNLKLSSVFIIVFIIGIIEVIGLVHFKYETELEVFINDIIRFVYCVLINSQGIFVFIVLLCNKPMYSVYNHLVKPTLCNYVPDAVYPTNERVKIKSMKVLNTISEGDAMYIFTERETIL